MEAYIKSLETLLPKFNYNNQEVIEAIKGWIKDQDEDYQQKVISIFENSNIKGRHSILPIDRIFSTRTVEEAMESYKRNAIQLGKEAFLKALDKAGWTPQDVDMIITTSCTGFMIPSFDAYIVEELKMRRDVKRLPVTQIGCAAGVTSLIYACDYLKAYPDSKVAVINLEFTTNTAQLDDYSMENVIGIAVFADGVSCFLLDNEKENALLEINDAYMHQVPDSLHLLGYNLVDTGLKMNLSKFIPKVVGRNFDNAIEPLLKRNNLTANSIDHYLVHPGGKKILEVIMKKLKEIGKDCQESYYIMSEYGNLSSATIGFIIKENLKRYNNPDDNILAMAFGPGFMAHQLIMKRV
ncbi:MAG: 3-oxoacyl-[acyl-carrier-protein] synthase III C-terminal domain-containing protein [Candidatus Thiodiazotropha sp.]|jgi:predicted naringenin-chalcone synthase